MKVIKLSWFDKFRGTMIDWHVSQESAARARALIRRDNKGPRVVFKTEAVDIPLTKPLLVQWLNKNLTSDTRLLGDT